MEPYVKYIISIYAFLIITIAFIELYNKEKKLVHKIKYHLNTNIKNNTIEEDNLDINYNDCTDYYRNYMYNNECNVIEKNACIYTQTSLHQYDNNNNNNNMCFSSLLSNFKNRENEYSLHDTNQFLHRNSQTDANHMYKEPFIDKIKNAFSKGNMEKTFADPLKPLIDFVKDIKQAFESLPKRVDKLNRAFKFVGEGIEKEFTNIGKSLNIGYNDLNNLAEGIGKCTIKFTSNLRHCILWYVLDLVGTVTYNTIVVFPLYLFKMILHIDLQKYVNEIHKFITYIDKCFVKTTKLSFLHFPKNITSNCYECSVNDEINQLKYDFEKVIPNLMNEPNKIFESAKQEFQSIFT